MNAAVAALRQDLANDVEILFHRLSQAQEFPAQHDDPSRLPYTALAMQHAYSALEAALERCIKRLDGELPIGKDSHRELLRRASAGIDGVRPALLSPASASVARQFLSFRHFLRHDYGAELDADQIAKLQFIVREGSGTLRADFAAFDAWLVSVSVL